MKATAKAIELIKRFESCALKAYKCPAGVRTIGYGNTAHARTRSECSKEEAERWLKEDIELCEIIISGAVRASLNQNQFDALVSLVFNIGGGNFGKSTLLKKLKAGDSAGAAAEFGRWIYAGGKVLPGLVKRRAEERKLFESND